MRALHQVVIKAPADEAVAVARARGLALFVVKENWHDETIGTVLAAQGYLTDWLCDDMRDDLPRGSLLWYSGPLVDASDPFAKETRP